MDLNPSYGTQDFIEQISHGSVASGGSASTSKKSSNGSKSKKSSNSSKNKKSGKSKTKKEEGGMGPSGGGSVSGGSAHVDEAYRRLGQRLSMQAHGETLPRKSPMVGRIQPNTFSGFETYSKTDQMQANVDFSPGVSSTGRSPKVAKMRYSDHGNHHQKQPPTTISSRVRPSRSLLRMLTFEAKQNFRQWEQEAAQNQKQKQNPPIPELSPQRFAFSQLSIESGGAPTAAATSASSRSTESGSLGAPHQLNGGDRLGLTWQEQQRSSHHRGGGVKSMMGKGLLSAVMEGHSDSATSASGRADRSTLASPASQSISTKGSTALSSLGGNANFNSNTASASAPSGSALVRGQCLTLPAEPLANDGYDNVEGNLIVYENDTIVVPRKGIHSVQPKAPKRSTEFRVQSLLGQGTFAQVFKCLVVETGEVVAVKIVKNKPAYTRQATIEIDVFRALMQQEDDKSKATGGGASAASGGGDGTTASALSEGSSAQGKDYMVNLMCYFMHRSHLCLVFELLGLNLYEILKRRQFRGLPLSIVRSIVVQSVEGVKELSHKSIVHCDLKPENILLVSDEIGRRVVNAGEGGQENASSPESPKTAAKEFGPSDESTKDASTASSNSQTIRTTNVGQNVLGSQRWVKLIDFGSACFEGYTAHTYIQSRFYRSPEVLVGLPYDSAIDMWSLGCVIAELFLGLPILPGVHEHDQLGRITEMISKVPDWMLDQGSKASKYYIKYVARPLNGKSPDGLSRTDDSSPLSSSGSGQKSPAPAQPQWRIKSLQEYISSLSQTDIKKKGGLAKLEKQPGNRYFRRTRLPDILMLHAQTLQGEERALVPAFVHFLYGMLEADPWKRWTAFQALQHPFVTGNIHQLRRKTESDNFDPKETNHANLDLEYYWKPPWDPAICRRKLLNVQKMREKQQSARRNMPVRSRTDGRPRSASGQMQPPQMREINGQVQTPQSVLDMGGMNMQQSSFGQVVSVSEQGSIDSQSMPGVGPYVPRNAGITASSLTDLGTDPSMRGAQLAIGTPGNAVAMTQQHQLTHTARSFNSTGYVPGTGVLQQADLAVALQRPGVVPATGGESVQSSHSGMSSQSFGSYDQYGVPQSLLQAGSLPHAGTSYPHQRVSHYGSADNANDPYAQVGRGQYSSGMDAGGMRQNPSRSNATPSSVASSVTMDNPNSTQNYTDVQQAAFQQQQFLQSQQQMLLQAQNMQQQQLLGLQQQQQMGAFMQQGMPTQQSQTSQQQQFQQPQQGGQVTQNQQQFALSQQPVIMAQSNQGGFYYVATTADGQQILLQPVQMGQQQGQMLQGQQIQGQQMQGQPTMQGQQMQGQPMQFMGQPQMQFQQTIQPMQQFVGQVPQQQAFPGQYGQQQGPS